MCKNQSLAPELTRTKKRTARPSAPPSPLTNSPLTHHQPAAVVAAVSAGGWQMGFQWVPSLGSPILKVEDSMARIRFARSSNRKRGTYRHLFGGNSAAHLVIKF